MVDTIATLRAKGLIGSCSGYPRPVMEKLVPAAAAGYARTTGSPPMTLPPAVVRARGWRCRT